MTLEVVQVPAIALFDPTAVPAFWSWTVASWIELAAVALRITLTWMPRMIALDGTEKPNPVAESVAPFELAEIALVA